MKAVEKGRTSAVDGVPMGQPALALASALLGRTAKAGLDVPVTSSVEVPQTLDDESVGANRLRNAPFAWIALDAGSDNAHNPFVRKNEVKALLAMAINGGGGGGGGETCEHPVCSTGDALSASCDSCAATVCAADAFCCQNSWDAQCVSEASQMCGLSCN